MAAVNRPSIQEEHSHGEMKDIWSKEKLHQSRLDKYFCIRRLGLYSFVFLMFFREHYKVQLDLAFNNVKPIDSGQDQDV